MPDWRSDYAPADAAELQLLPSEGELRPAHLRVPRRPAVLAGVGFVALGLLLAVTAWAGEHRWRPRSSGLANLEVKQANDGVSVSDPQVSIRAVDAKVVGYEQEPSTEQFTSEKASDEEEEEAEYTSSEWEVIYSGTAHVRKDQDINADVLATKPSGTIVVGRVSDSDDTWLALVHEPGFMAISIEGTEILKRRPVSYSRVLKGACKDVSKHPIWDASTCQNAGFALGYFDTTIGIYHGELDRPEGCYEYRGQLWVATNPKHHGKGAMGDRKPICSSNSYPTTTTTTTTHTTTTRTITRTSTTTTTWGYPSLFCVEVVRSHGYELPLVKAQQRVRASIFSCDEFRVFSDGGRTEVIGVGPDGLDITTIVIPPIENKKMALNFAKGVTTNSWLNTETFLQVWDIAHRKDGRLLRHDWVVKVDPDAVFFPDRLRERLRPHTVRGASSYVMNCDKYKPVALYGSMEVFSQQAMKTYVERQRDCRNNLKWQGWGEDFYMSHCMDYLHVQPIYDFTLLGDSRCHGAPCSDTSKVVFHPFKNQTGWFGCWHQSRAAQGLR